VQYFQSKFVPCNKYSKYTEVSVVVFNNPPPSVHTSPDKFKTAAIFIRFGLPRAKNPLSKQSFSKTLFKPEEFENTGFAFSCRQKHFANGAFRKRRHQSKAPVRILEISNLSGLVWMGSKTDIVLIYARKEV